MWPENSFKVYACSAGISGFICNVVTNPFWVVRTRMQAEIFRSAHQEHYQKQYQGIFKSIQKIYSEEGIRALFAGLTASIVGISHALIYFPLYEKSKFYFLTHLEPKGADKISSKYVFISAVVSKVISSALTYPHEVVRARQQDSRLYENKSNKLLHVIKQTFKKEGLQAFYNGYGTNLIRMLPHYAIIFILYEQFSYSLSKYI